MNRLAIADPPYPPIRAAHPRNDSSRAQRWYDRDYRKSGDARFASDHHENAAEWDDPARHRALILHLEAEYDGWAIATAHDGLPVYGELPRGARIAIWHRPNGGVGAARIRNVWEPVIVRPPTDRLSSRLMGGQLPDLLSCASPRVGFAGAKPPQWTRWVLDMLGYDPETDHRRRPVPRLRLRCRSCRAGRPQPRRTPRVTARSNNPDTSCLACVCGELDLCWTCHAPMCCGPEKAPCDRRDHCTDPLCLTDCNLCLREMGTT